VKTSWRVWTGNIGPRLSAKSWSILKRTTWPGIGATAQSAVLGKLAPANPIRAIKHRKAPKHAKPVYKTDEVRRRLDCAWTHGRELVPYFAIAIFARVRPESAIERLQWDDVNFEEGWIRAGTHFS